MPEAWPPLNAVRELATQLKKLRKGRESDNDFSPFVAVDLAKFLPDDFAEFKPVRLDSSPEMVKLFGGPAKGRRMTLANWLLAWRRCDASCPQSVLPIRWLGVAGSHWLPPQWAYCPMRSACTMNKL